MTLDPAEIDVQPALEFPKVRLLKDKKRDLALPAKYFRYLPDIFLTTPTDV